MRRALAIALTTSLALPAAVDAAHPYKHDELAQRTLLVDKSLIAHQRAGHARHVEELRAARRAERRRERANASVAIPSHLAAIAACESGGNPQAIGGGGQYRGLFQFDMQTWQAVGGQGDPAAASVAEQVKRAEILYAQAGAGQWPVCGA
jgi:hypothetical protein